jgi:NADPH:quinone reductase-like Zn-dependent oxidoreductase
MTGRSPAHRTMRGLVGHALGPPENFALDDLPVPEPGVGEVRIAVEAATLGFVDGLLAAGRYQIRPPVPYVPAGEIAGSVDAVGNGVTDFRVGDRVATWQLGGGAAQYCLAPAVELDRIPAGLPAVAAAALLVDGPAAHHALFERGLLQEGETVLVLGAAGGVGAAAIQLARAAGAIVVAGAGSAEKRDHAASLGAQAVIDYRMPDWRNALRSLLPATGLDLVLDPVGGTAFEPAFRSLAKGGRYLVVGFAGGAIPSLPANLPLLKSASLIGADLRHFAATRPTELSSLRKTLFEQADAGSFIVPIGPRLAMTNADGAFGLLADRSRVGKVAILPRQ